MAAALGSLFGEEGLGMRQHLEQLDGDEPEVPQALAGPEAALLGDARRHWSRMERLSEEARRRRFVGWMQVRGHALMHWAALRLLRRRRLPSPSLSAHSDLLMTRWRAFTCACAHAAAARPRLG